MVSANPIDPFIILQPHNQVIGQFYVSIVVQERRGRILNLQHVKGSVGNFKVRPHIDKGVSDCSRNIYCAVFTRDCLDGKSLSNLLYARIGWSVRQQQSGLMHIFSLFFSLSFALSSVGSNRS